ncbi:gamma-glutamylcyclotransferase [Balneatrix alpica]|uniref:glutathione-specific gamma-glutamylcyclotransferase n=1 Tax=Balneatrix alpica TaxID=75684 RepID=A0ABV5ZCR9_9GAMM|nr:gamma-glutamylcyclotransferase [Balneatrix alpica]
MTLAIPQPPAQQELWVFAYGSLIWNPGFHYQEVREARLYGYHRALCVWSIEHRGTPEQPGLVFGLDKGGCCRGRVYRVEDAQQWQVLSYLAKRELLTAIYQPRYLRVHTAEGVVTALCFLANAEHPQYAGRLCPEQAALAVAMAAGHSGRSLDYLRNTLSELNLRGLRDARLEHICAQAQHWDSQSERPLVEFPSFAN